MRFGVRPPKFTIFYDRGLIFCLLFGEQSKAAPAPGRFFFLAKKAGGRYVTVSDNVRMLDDTGHQIIMADGTNIPIDDVRFIEGSLFDAYEQ